MRISKAIVVPGILIIAAVAHAQHMDLRPHLDNNKIAIGAAESQGGVVVPLSDRQYVFGAEFGEADPGQPYFGQDPGFLAEPGAFPGGSLIGFNIRSGLRYWTGTGFGDVPHGEILMVAKGSHSLTLSEVAQQGFYFGVFDGEGGLHEHLEWQLSGPDGNPPPGGMVAPTVGVYLVELELKTDLPGVANSDPIWLVFNNGDEEAHEAAVNWIQETYLPEPTSLLLLALGAFAMVGRRGRR